MRQAIRLVDTLTPSLIIASTASMVLYAVRVQQTGSLEFGFILWNIFLAWLPLGFAYILARLAGTDRLGSWRSIALLVLWLLFLPNAFYIVSDFIHIRFLPTSDPMFDAAMLMVASGIGLVLGCLSLYVVYTLLAKRYSTNRLSWFIPTVALASAFAIYLGRNLRWNSWDIIVNPFGLFNDVGERILNPGAYPELLTTMIGYSMLILVSYFVLLPLFRHFR